MLRLVLPGLSSHAPGHGERRHAPGRALMTEEEVTLNVVTTREGNAH
jgi:hypothetical protein